MNKKFNKMFDVETIRSDFPILNQEINGSPLIYFDNAASTQKPKSVITSISNYYKKDHSNVHRGVHSLSVRATEEYEQSQMAQLVQTLEQMIFILNNTYTPVTLGDEEEQRAWFLS